MLISQQAEKYLWQILGLKTLLEILRPTCTGTQNDNGDV